jgi:hypothetical protein
VPSARESNNVNRRAEAVPSGQVVIIFAILAAASAWLVTRKAPQHRPLAWALMVCTGIDAVRLLGLPARADMALCLCIPAASAWLYLVTFGRRIGGEWFVGLTGMACGAWLAFGVPTTAWEYVGPFGYMVPTAIGTGAVISHYINGRSWAITQRVALILLGGDMLAVASLCEREWISRQACAVLGLVTLYQLTWWWRWNRAENERW